MASMGIDLGTSFFRMAVLKDGEMKALLNDQGNPCIPAFVGFTDDGIVVGEDALKVEAENTIYGVKRFLGRKFSDVKGWINRLPFKIAEGSSGFVEFEVNYRCRITRFCPEEIVAIIFAKCKQLAEEYLSREITDAVITVPPMFNNAQRQSIVYAGDIAGLKIRLLNDTTAYGMKYCSPSKASSKKKVLVCSLGAGSCCVSVLKISGGDITVLAAAGDACLGGNEVDELLLEHVKTEFRHGYGREMDLPRSAVAIVEEAKKSLSEPDQDRVSIAFTEEDGTNCMTIVTRDTFERICHDFTTKIVDLVAKVLEMAKLSSSDIYEYLLTGGGAQIPMIATSLQRRFRTKGLEVFARDCALEAATLAAKLVGDGEKIEKSVNLTITEVTPYALGITTRHGQVEKTVEVVKRNSRVPYQYHQTFTRLSSDAGSSVFRFDVSQKLEAGGCLWLGAHEFELSRLKKSKRDSVKVSFCIDDDNQLTVLLIDENSGRIVTYSLGYGITKWNETEVGEMRLRIARLMNGDYDSNSDLIEIEKQEAISPDQLKPRKKVTFAANPTRYSFLLDNSSDEVQIRLLDREEANESSELSISAVKSHLDKLNDDIKSGQLDGCG